MAGAEAYLASLPRRLIALPRRWLQEAPDAPAITDGTGRTVDYRTFNAMIDAAAGLLTDLGVRPGDRVMVVNENGLAVGTLLFAISSLDAWPVIVNARLSGREIDTIADHCGARRVFFTTDISPEAAAHAARHGAEAVELPDVSGIHVGPLRDATPEPVHDDPAKQVGILIYTSGTTGMPKGVMLSHQALIFVASSPGSQAPIAPGDVVFGALPVSHIYGLSSTFLRTIYGGGQILSLPRFDPALLVKELKDRLSVMQGVPQMYARLLEYAAKEGIAIEAPYLRFATIGGAYVEPELKEAAENALGRHIAVGYGMTEFASTVTRSLPEHAGRDTTAGPCLPGIEAKVVENGTDMPQGETGEIWLRGPNRMLGYYRNPEATNEVLTEDGWYRTGDLGWIDEKGYIHFAERRREVIIRSGFNVYPGEVEAVLSSHPDITLSAVVGRQVTGNEEVVAFVQPMPGRTVDTAALAAYAAERLAPYKRPAEIVLMPELPAAATGKILKARLRELAAERRAS